MCPVKLILFFSLFFNIANSHRIFWVSFFFSSRVPCRDVFTCVSFSLPLNPLRLWASSLTSGIICFDLLFNLVWCIIFPFLQLWLLIQLDSVSASSHFLVTCHHLPATRTHSKFTGCVNRHILNRFLLSFLFFFSFFCGVKQPILPILWPGVLKNTHSKTLRVLDLC